MLSAASVVFASQSSTSPTIDPIRVSISNMVPSSLERVSTPDFAFSSMDVRRIFCSVRFISLSSSSLLASLHLSCMDRIRLLPASTSLLRDAIWFLTSAVFSTVIVSSDSRFSLLKASTLIRCSIHLISPSSRSTSFLRPLISNSSPCISDRSCVPSPSIRDITALNASLSSFLPSKTCSNS